MLPANTRSKTVQEQKQISRYLKQFVVKEPPSMPLEISRLPVFIAVVAMLLLPAIPVSTEDVIIIFGFPTLCCNPGVGIIVPAEEEELACR